MSVILGKIYVAIGLARRSIAYAAAAAAAAAVHAVKH